MKFIFGQFLRVSPMAAVFVLPGLLGLVLALLAAQADSPTFTLIGTTVVLALFALAFLARRTKAFTWLAGEHNCVLPVAIFVAMAVGTYVLHEALQERELAYMEKLVREEANEIERLLAIQADYKLLTLKAMSMRWEKAGGTAPGLWQDDAAIQLENVSGLKAVQWMDSSYRVRWVAPLQGNEDVVGELPGPEETPMLQSAAQKHVPALGSPVRMAHGYDAFPVYLPLTVDGKFDGFIVGIFSIDDFFGTVMTDELDENYLVSMSYGGREYFRSNPPEAAPGGIWAVNRALPIFNSAWNLHLAPKQQFVANEQTPLPLLLLGGGLLIAALSALSVRWMLVAGLRSMRLEQANQNLRTSEETFRLAMENAAISMALVEPSGRWLSVNQALCDMLGYEKEELLQGDFQSVTHPDDLVTDLDYVRKLMAGEIQTYKLDRRYYHKSGKVIWTQLSVSLVHPTNGEADYLVAQILDITEQREMEQTKNEFVSIVSHELRTPLTSIRGSLGLILGAFSADLPEKVRGLIDIANSNCERLILLVNDILDMEKIAAGQMRVEIKTESLAAITLQAVKANEAYAHTFDARIMLEPIAETLNVELDANRYVQVLTNLLSNAAKFSPQGATIRVFVVRSGDRVRISVKDQGPGIPKEFRARVFGRFSQLDYSSTRAKGGTGLGLHITKQIVEQMNGQIGFDADSGKGTTFWVEFLIARDVKDLPPASPTGIATRAGPAIDHELTEGLLT